MIKEILKTAVIVIVVIAVLKNIKIGGSPLEDKLQLM